MQDLSYEEIRDKVIKQYKILMKDQLALDICEVPKDIRLRILQDEVYISKTKAIKASLFAQQLETLDAVLAGQYASQERPTDQSAVILKALEMKQKLLLEDLNITKDESNALNVTFVAMSEEDFKAMDTVEVFEGSNTAQLGADFGEAGEEDSFESRMKVQVNKKLKEQKENKQKQTVK